MSTPEQREKNKANRYGFNACNGRPSDTTKLIDSVDTVYNLLPSPTIQELIMFFNGDKQRTAKELAGIDSSKKEYNNALRNVNRYLKKERKPSKAVQSKFKKLYVLDSTKDLEVYIKGCVQVSNEYYYKDSTWNKPIIIKARYVKRFIKLTQQDIEDGYRFLNGIYMKSGFSDDTIVWLDNVEIKMLFK